MSLTKASLLLLPSLLLPPLLPSIFSSLLLSTFPLSSRAVHLHACTGLYDCTDRENTLVAHFARLPSFSACLARCSAEPRCRHFTYNYAGHLGHYPGACFLLASCTVRHPGAEQWMSAPRECYNLPQHARDLATRNRLQLAIRSQ